MDEEKSVKFSSFIGILLPFLIIIVLEVIGLYALNLLNKDFRSQIDNLESAIKNKEEDIAKAISQGEGYIVFSQLVNVVEFVKRKQSVNFFIERFNSLMPKFLEINSFSFDRNNKEITVDGYVNNLNDYIRFSRYLNGLTAVKVKSISQPYLTDGEKMKISFVISLQPDFYK